MWLAANNDGSAVDEKLKYGWLKLSISALFLAATAVTVWLGWQYRTVYERLQVRKFLADRRGGLSPPLPDQTAGLPWYRQILGDEAVGTIWLPKATGNFLSTEEQERIKMAFPEATPLNWPDTNSRALRTAPNPKWTGLR